jgi:methyl-accepting chemotaxis protein
MSIDLAAVAGIEPADAAKLRALKPDLARRQNDAIAAFYKHILAFPAFRTIIETTCERQRIDVGQLVAHISEVQFAHWQHLFDGTPDEELRNVARKIGTVHETCGLTNDLYVASSTLLLEKLLAIGIEHHLGDSDEASQVKDTLTAIVRMFFLDLSYTISAYDHAAARTAFRQASEPLLNAFEDDVARDLESMVGAAGALDTTIRNIVDLNHGNMRRCHETVSSIETLTANLDELGQITRHIENFVKVIANVSRKTKLLALNAAIEAARSGEYGRGFKVVAGEVKALANEAEEATREVTAQAGEIRAAIAVALAQVDQSQKLVQAIDRGVATESQAITQQSTVVSGISNDLAAVSQSARRLREKFNTLDAA